MRSHQYLLFVSIIIILIAACTVLNPPAVEESAEEVAAKAEADVAALDQLRDDYVSAVNSGDAATIAGLHTEDAIIMWPNGPRVIGTEAIRARFEGNYELTTAELNVSTEGNSVNGDSAHSWGSFTLTVTPKAEGEPLEDEGKWVNVYKRQDDGSWKYALSIWNSDKPLPESPSE